MGGTPVTGFMEFYMSTYRVVAMSMFYDKLKKFKILLIAAYILFHYLFSHFLLKHIEVSLDSTCKFYTK